jgi:hypothetical protein
MPPELERALRELEPDWPPTPDLAAAVRARIARAPARRRLRLHPAWVAAAVGLLIVAGVAATPSARSSVLRWLGLEHEVKVRRAPPGATPPPARRGAQLGLGAPVTLAQARRAVGFAIPVPATLGPPEAVYLADGRVSLVYRPRAGIPRSRISGAGLLVMAVRGSAVPLIQKTVGAGTRVEHLTVAGAPALWLDHAHGFAYATPGGGGTFEPQRLADRTLLVDHFGVLLRVEGRISRARAVAIAQSAF